MKLFGLIAFSALGLAILKFMPLAIFYNLALVSYAYPTILDTRFTQAFDRLYLVIEKIPKSGLSFMLLCISIVLFSDPYQNPLARRIPQKSLHFILDKKLPMPIMNTFNDGGYISYRFADNNGQPGTKVAIDGRTNLISTELWRQYSAAINGYENWQVFINRTNANTILWPQSSALIALLKQSGEWCEVFREGYGSSGFVTFVRKGSFLSCS